jgi:hypothetical protein
MATDDVNKIFIATQELELVDYFRQAAYYMMVYENSRSPWFTTMPAVIYSMLHYGLTKKESFKCAFQCGKGSSIIVPERQGKNVYW